MCGYEIWCEWVYVEGWCWILLWMVGSHCGVNGVCNRVLWFVGWGGIGSGIWVF